MKITEHLKTEDIISFTKKRFFIIALILIFIASLISFTIFKFTSRKSPNQASVSVLGTTTVNAGQKLVLPIVIDTKGQNINAAEVYLNFNPRLLRIDEINKESSFFKIWIQDSPKYSNEEGTISFAGGLPKPGYTGKGQIGTITVTLLQNRDATLVFTPKTRVLLNDGKGTAIPLTVDPITIKLKK